MIEQVKYSPHEIALLVPRPTAKEQDELTDSIREIGLQAPVILYEGKVLDGVSRQLACLRAQKKCRYVEFADLHPDIRAAGPVAFVVGQNFKRRHLTTSQRSIFAAETLPAFEAEAKKRKLAKLRNQDVDLAATLDEESGGKSRDKAAKAANVSPAQVQKAKKLLKTDPKKAAAVKAGKMSLHAATRDKKAEAKAAREVSKLSKGLSMGDTIATLCTKAARVDKFTVVLEQFKIVVTKVKKRGRPAKK